MKFDLFEKAKEKIIIVAHRGTFGANIPCNTIPAYKTAILEGADMIEIDVDASRDGTLFIFHPGMEPVFLGTKTRLKEMSDEEVRAQRYINYDNAPTAYGLNTLEEVFEEFKNKCFINVDKFWMNPEKIWKEVKRHNIEEQILVKSALNENVITVLENIAPTAAFMPIVSRTHPYHEKLLKSNINYVGAECLFYEDSDEVCSHEFIERMHRDGKLTWANAIIYNYKEQIAAGHSDDTSIITNPIDGWGWLARRGFDFIQTDWVPQMHRYLKENDLLFRK